MGEALTAVNRFYDAFAAKNWDAADDNFADDCAFVFPTGTPTKAEHRAMGEAFGAALPDAHMEIDHVVDGGDEAFVEGRFVGTHSGEFVTPEGAIPASNNKVELRFADFFKTAGGKIVEHRTYWDTADMMRQLGAMG
jgi:steroid delta-isomerase-like uncharacterized protein